MVLMFLSKLSIFFSKYREMIDAETANNDKKIKKLINLKSFVSEYLFTESWESLAKILAIIIK